MEDKNVSLDMQMRLAEILNDTPRKVKLGSRDFELRALRPGAQWLIAEESCKIAKAEENNFSDLIRQFAINKPAVVRCICIAILNDKAKIEGPEYAALQDYIMWETKESEWMSVLIDVLNMLDLESFFRLTSAVALLRETTLTRKMTEPKQSIPEPNGDR